MIVKKVNRKTSSSKSGSIKRLVDYIEVEREQDDKEKVLYKEGRNFICDDRLSRQQEMIALASECVKSKNPVSHYIMSWKEHEKPSIEQVEEAVSIFLGEMGLSEHQTIYSLHQDTKNIHLHLAINRVHPDTGKVVEINNGFDIEVAHKAIAKIEYKQGWETEKNALYRYIDGELVNTKRQRKEREPSQRVRDREHRTNEKSLQRCAIEKSVNIIKSASSWGELHKDLAEMGIRYERKGNGGVIFLNDIGMKASSVYREASLTKLQKRFGEFIGSDYICRDVLYRKQPVKNSLLWEVYIDEREEHKKRKEKEKLDIKEKHTKEWAILREKLKEERENLLSGSWQGRGAELNAMRSVLASQQAIVKIELKENQRAERINLFSSFPDYKNWLEDEISKKKGIGQVISVGNTYNTTSMNCDIRSYDYTVVGSSVCYKDKEKKDEVAFIDRGKVIEIYDIDRKSVLASLQLAQQKFGEFEISGSDKYKSLCIELAKEHKFRIVNPEFKEELSLKDKPKFSFDI